MHFQSVDLVYSVLHELLHRQPLVLPDLGSPANSPLQNQILSKSTPVFFIPPLHDYLLHVWLDPH